MSRRANKESVSSDNGSTAGVALSDVESIVNNICHKAVEAAIGVLREEFGKLFEEYNEKLVAMEKRLQVVEEITRKSEDRLSNVEDISKRLDTIDTDISTLKNNCEINNMKKDIREATNIANDTEQYSRRNNIRIRGLTVQEHDDCKDVVADFLVNKLHLQDLRREDIEGAHPLPTSVSAHRRRNASTRDEQSNSQQMEPIIIVRFKSRRQRDSVMRQRRLLKGTRYTIIEDLTALNVQTLNRARNHGTVTKTWTWNGKIFALTRDGQKILVKPFQPISECAVI